MIPGRLSSSNGWRLLLLFVVLAAVHTWPLLPQVATHSLDDGDSLLNGWLLAAVTRAIATHPLTLFDINAYYPYHHALATLDHQLGAVVFTGPLYLISGNPQLALNLYTFATFALGGFFAALLAAEITGSTVAGIVAGSLFAFSSGRMENMNHAHVLGNFWLPLALLLMHRYLGAPTWRNVAALAAVALLLALTAWYNAALGPLALAIVAAAGLLRQGRRAAGAVGRLAIAALAAGVVVAAIALPYTRVLREFRSPPRHASDAIGAVASDAGEHRTISASVIQDNSTGLEAFAGVRETASAPWLKPFRKMGLVGGRFFPGIASAALALIALVLIVRAQARTSWLAWPALALGAIFAAAVLSLTTHRFMSWPLVVTRSDWFFAFLVASFVLWIALPAPASPSQPWLEHARTYFVIALVGGALSLGVTVYLVGRPIAHGIYPANAPGFDLLRAPVRFGALCALGTAVLAACGYVAVTRRLDKRMQTVAALCAVVLVNVELFAPMPRMRHLPRVPDVYAWLRRAPAGAVVEFPSHGNLWSLHWSLAHLQPLAQGYGLVEPPAYARLRDTDDLSPAMVEHIRSYMHARYIVVDRTKYTGEKDAQIAANLAQNEGTLTKVAAADGREVYEIGGPSRGAPVLRAYRPWMLEGARGVSVDADLDPARAGVPHVLQVWGNGRLLASAPWQPNAPAPRLFAPLPSDHDEGLNVEVLGDYAARPAEISVDAGLRTRLQINGHVWMGRTGYTLAVIAPDGRVDDVRTFNTSWFESASHDLAARIAAIPPGWTAVLATNYDASRALTADAVKALRTLGMAADLRGRFRVMHAGIGTKGAAPGTAIEQVAGDAARCAIGAPSLVQVSVRDVRLY